MSTVCEQMSHHPALKALFSSQTRVKLLSTFLLHPDQEFFIRELTRLLSEQINSVRRELENLKRIGLVKSRQRNRKKYYRVDSAFDWFTELRHLFTKAIQQERPLVTSLKNLPNIRLVLLAGTFCGTDSKVDLLIVGDVKKDAIEALLAQDPQTKNARYSAFSEADFLYRLSLKDRFVQEILTDPRHLIVYNTLQKEIAEVLGK